MVDSCVINDKGELKKHKVKYRRHVTTPPQNLKINIYVGIVLKWDYQQASIKTPNKRHIKVSLNKP